MKVAHFAMGRIGVKMNKRIDVDAEGLLLLMDRLADAFRALDGVVEAYDTFVNTTVHKEELSNVVDLEKRRINKDPNEVYNNKGDK